MRSICFRRKRNINEEEKGRACKDAALAMLADIYLTLAPNHRDYYNEVVTLCNNIAAMGYDLTQCNYADNFNATINNGAESLFEVQYSVVRNMTFGAAIIKHPGCLLSWGLVIQVWWPVLMDGTCLRKNFSSNMKTVICGKT